jgi:sirohydrochlorin cobaltochelatase
MTMATSPRGMLLFAHGARDPAWAVPFQAVDVELAFLEFMAPDFSTAAQQLAGRCASIDIVPLFLGAGGHVRRDLPVLVDAMRAAHPGVHWRLHPPVGELAPVIAAIAAAAASLGHAPRHE